MTYHNPLELKYWLVQVFSESSVLFSLVGLIVLAYICAKLKVPSSIFLILTLMFGGIILAIGQNWILGIILFVGGPILFYLIRRFTD